MPGERRIRIALPPAEATWFCVRRRGRAERSGWLHGVSLRDLPRQVGADTGTVVEVCTAHDFRPVEPARFSRVFSAHARGLLGMEIVYRDEVCRIAPTWMVATNRSFERVLERFLTRRHADVAGFAAEGRLRAFSARQFLVSGSDRGRPAALYRGAPPVAPTASIDADRVAHVAEDCGLWMLRNLAADGALPYKYWPSRGVESAADNAIRRFLASLALARLGALRGDAETRGAARRNLRFNLTRYFRDIGGGRGAIVERTGAKLGAAAIAALAILESPAPAEFQPELTMLAAGVDALADDEVGFRTFFFPRERDGENWNFYSGEALLFWAEAIRRGAGFAPSPERWTAAFTRCRERHARARNPAFVPWHTQACAAMFEQTQRRELAACALEMNDWLLPMQQWGPTSGLPPDLWGRFHDPQRPDFGPPHAASTGAYLEGLADAVPLARALGDGARAATYERALARGLRSLRQLQFRDQRDAFYVSRRRRLLGALRTEAYDNAIRIDSTAHALAAAVKLLQRGVQRSGGRT